MVSSEEVIMAYRLCLGREPEDGAMVAEYARTVKDVRALREQFLGSEEFSSGQVVRLPVSLDRGPGLRVDAEVSGEVLQAMLGRVEDTWRGLGKTEPFWSVLSTDQFKRDHFGQNADTYCESGQRDVERLNAWLKRNGISGFGPVHSCCEYGCGTGRVTRWLAPQFSRVVACDISGPHIELAQQHLAANGISNVSFRQIDSLEALAEIEPVDLVFSFIVLQHNPPPVIVFILANMLRWLKPGGLAFFQVPTYFPSYAFDAVAYLKQPASGSIEMHVLPQRNVFEIAAQQNCEVLEVQPDGHVGLPHWISNTFLLRKR